MLKISVHPAASRDWLQKWVNFHRIHSFIHHLKGLTLDNHRATSTDKQKFTFTPINLTSMSRMWEEAGVPVENPHRPSQGAAPHLCHMDGCVPIFSSGYSKTLGCQKSKYWGGSVVSHSSMHLSKCYFNLVFSLPYKWLFKKIMFKTDFSLCSKLFPLLQSLVNTFALKLPVT